MFGKKDSELTAERVKAAIEGLPDAVLAKPIGELGFVKDVLVEPARVRIALELPTPAWSGKPALIEAIQRTLAPLVGERAIDLALGSDVKRARPDAPSGQNLVPGARNIILCASGKGGVGKSTIASNLAAALAHAGANVGLLDADIYGPSIPTMFGTRQMPSIAAGGSRLTPVVQHGLKLMSIGFVVDPEEAMVWRGPMLNGAVLQFMRDVDWGDLDYLILDLPPGTGDVQLTIAQNVRVAGAVLVSTPQDVALADVSRAKAMFDRVDIPVLGVVENMSSFQCGNCGTVHEIFSHGGAARLAEKLGLPMLGEVPIELGVREAGDRGRPVVLSAPESVAAQALTGIAIRVATDLAKVAEAQNSPGARAATRLKIVQ